MAAVAAAPALAQPPAEVAAAPVAAQPPTDTANPPLPPFRLDDCVESLTNAAFAESAKPARLSMEARSCSAASGTGCVAPVTEVAVLGGAKDGRAFLRYGGKQKSPRTTTGGALEVSVPYNKDEDEGVFASLDAISGDVTIGATGSYKTWGSLNAGGYAAALCKMCDEQKVDILHCNPDSLAELLTPQQGRDMERKIVAGAFGRGLVGSSFTLELEAGRKPREYFDTAAKVVEEDRSTFAVDLSWTGMLKNGTTTLEFVQKRDYKPAKAATLCSAISGSLLEECTTKPRARAQAKDSSVGGVEWKLLLRGFAIAPALQRDFEENVWGAQLPIFLVRDEDGALTGGLRLGWRSDTDDFSAAIFVSKPFDL